MNRLAPYHNWKKCLEKLIPLEKEFGMMDALSKHEADLNRLTEFFDSKPKEVENPMFKRVGRICTFNT
jgi:hypothetical protein